MSYKVIENQRISRRFLLGRVSMGLVALGVAPLSLLGCGNGDELPPSIADGRITGTSLDGAVVALTNVTQTNNPNEPVLGRVVLNDKVLPVTLNVSSNIQQAFTLVESKDGEARYASTFYDSAQVEYDIDTTVTELANGFLVKVMNGSNVASLLIPKSLVPTTETAQLRALRETPQASIVLWIVIVVAASWLIAQLIDLAKMAICLAEGGTYTSSINITAHGTWVVQGTCTKPTGGTSPR